MSVDVPPAPLPRSTAADRRQPKMGKGNFELYAWVFMRVSGVLLVLLVLAHFAIMHVLDGGLDRVMSTYRNPIVGLLEIGLAVLIIFHALNGLRIILFDFWSQGVARQRQMLWVQTVLFLVLAIPPVIAIGAHVVEEL